METVMIFMLSLELEAIDKMAKQIKLFPCNLCKRRFDSREECDLHLTSSSCAVIKMIEKNLSKQWLQEKILDCPLCHLSLESEVS